MKSWMITEHQTKILYLYAVFVHVVEDSDVGSCYDSLLQLDAKEILFALLRFQITRRLLHWLTNQRNHVMHV